MSYPAYPSYQNSEIKWLGQLPDHWSITALKRNFQICAGSTPDPDPKNWDGEISWYTPADLSGLETFQLGASKRTISKAGLFSSGCTLLPEGSIVISTRAPIGSLGITTTSGCTNQGCKGLVPASNISPVYYAYLLVTGKAELNSRGRGSTFTEISGEELGVIRVPVPPHIEQTQIARFLDHQTARIDALIAEQQRLIELLKEKRQAVISHAVTKGLDPDVAMKDSGVEWLGRIPENWKVARLRYLVSNSVAGPYGSSLTKSMYTDRGYRVYGQQQVIPNDFSVGDYYISDEKFREMQRYRVDEGDVLVSVMGTIGKAAIVPGEAEDGIINPRLVKYSVDQRRILPEYFQTFINSYPTQAQLSLEAKGSTMEGLNLKILGDVQVAVPPLPEQKRIVDVIELKIATMDETISNADKLINLLQERRSALISAAVTGKIDVRDWEPPITETFPSSTTREEAPA